MWSQSQISSHQVILLIKIMGYIFMSLNQEWYNAMEQLIAREQIDSGLIDWENNTNWNPSHLPPPNCNIMPSTILFNQSMSYKFKDATSHPMYEVF